MSEDLRGYLTAFLICAAIASFPLAVIAVCELVR
jgi:hypothetical protein